MMIWQRLLCIAIGYGFGNLLSGYFLGKKKNVDIRKEGSGNVGSTNTMRTLGMKAGAFTLLCDCCKCIVAVLVTGIIFSSVPESQRTMLQLYAAIGAILGHDFPVYLKFKGGKGVACSFGMIVALFPQCIPLCVIAFFVIVGITRYVSLGSMLTAILFFVQVIVFGQKGWLRFEQESLRETILLVGFAVLLLILLHRSNIKRLLNGNENKLSFQSKRE